MLGRILMEVRTLLRNEAKLTPFGPYASGQATAGYPASTLVKVAMSANQYDSELASLPDTYANGLRANITRLKAAIAGASEASVIAVGSGRLPILLRRCSARFTQLILGARIASLNAARNHLQPDTCCG